MLDGLNVVRLRNNRIDKNEKILLGLLCLISALLIFNILNTDNPACWGSSPSSYVVYNVKSGIYHKQSCEYAQRYTVNCITITKKSAISRGGRPCKRCGG